MHIAITGPRPSKLTGQYDPLHPFNVPILHVFYDAIEQLFLCHHMLTIYNGMALGIDQWSFLAALQVKEAYQTDLIRLIASIPFSGQERKWPLKSQQTYHELLKQADEIIIVDTLPKYQMDNVPPGIYHPQKLLIRNQHMLDQCDLLLGFWDGKQSGGTAQCVRAALKQGIPFQNLYFPSDRR